jgi:hypothetical protein
MPKTERLEPKRANLLNDMVDPKNTKSKRDKDEPSFAKP